MHRLPGEQMVPGCTMGGRQAGRGSVILWAMLYWETLSPAIHVVVTLTRTNYLSIVADCVHPFMKTVFPDGSGLFQQDNAPCHKAKILQDGLRRTKTSLMCRLGLQIPQISIQPSICQMWWTNKSDPWRPHLATYRTQRICCKHLGARYHSIPSGV